MGKLGLKLNGYRLILSVIFVCIAMLLFVSPSFSYDASKVYTKTVEGVTVSVYSELKVTDGTLSPIVIWNIQIVNKSENKFKISPLNISLLIDKEIFKPLPNLKINYDGNLDKRTIVNEYILKHNPLQETSLAPNDAIDGNVFYKKKVYYIARKAKKVHLKMVLPVIEKNENLEIVIDIPVTGKYENRAIDFQFL